MSTQSNTLIRKQSYSNLQELNSYTEENELTTNSNIHQRNKSFSMIISNHTKNMDPNTINKIYGRLLTIYHEPNVSDILLNSIMEKIGFVNQELYYRIE
jgi:hypothetical protein